MRDISIWSKNLHQNLRQSEELRGYITNQNLDERETNKEISRLAKLIAEVELGLTLLRQIAPHNPANSVSFLLSGYRFPIHPFEDEQNWRLIQNARFYLLYRKGRQWERSLEDYLQIPEYLRSYALTEASGIPELIPCSIFPQRWQLYQNTLQRTPPHKVRKVKLAHAGLWYAKILNSGQSPTEIPIYIPESVTDLPSPPQVSFLRTREANNPAYTVTLEQLKQVAQEMDNILEASGYGKENYRERLDRIILKIYEIQSDDFCQNEELTIYKLLNIVGLLNVGKSTVIEVLSYLFATQKKRCAIVVSDVVTSVRLASLFRFGLKIPAAPILGDNRPEQLKKVYEPIFANQGEEIAQGAIHAARIWFNAICPLLGLVQSEEKWEFGSEPCHTLYQKIPIPNGQNSNNDNDEEEEKIEDDEKFTCPLYYHCPRHQLEKDIAQALIWVLTPASLIHTSVPRQVFSEKIRFAEAVYRECDFLFIDEADRVQVQLDDIFSPDETLLDNSSSSFLNKIGINLSSIYQSNRRIMTADLFNSWTNAQYDAQKALNKICLLLYGQEKLLDWLGITPFTGYSLFSRLIKSLVEPSETTETPPQNNRRGRNRRQQQQWSYSREQRNQQQELIRTVEGFLQSPLNRRKGKELTDIALTLLSTDQINLVLEDIRQWWLHWLETNDIPSPETEQFEDLIHQTRFAIIIAVLDNRLGFLVDNLTAISRYIDLHDLSQSLVFRPPRDYLPVVPSAPVGNLLGFRYIKDRESNKAGRLDYFRYVGVGRALLLNFPKLWAIDDRDGPHTLLISGTSYAPGSPAYHIIEQPTVLLEPQEQTANAGIAESKFFYTPQESNGEYIKISGLLPSSRKKAVRDLVKAISTAPKRAKTFINQSLEELEELGQQDPNQWGDRSRLLLLTNSYDEADIVDSELRRFYRIENLEYIACLRRDNAPSDLIGIRRGKIRDLAKLPTQIVAGPLMALERGHNILNDQKIAAFGTAVFLVRPMPVPDDWQIIVQQLNNWALLQEKNPIFCQNDEIESLNLKQIEELFYQSAMSKMRDLHFRPKSFLQLDDEERAVLCWTQAVSIWQVIGRLVRGGVPCRVYFLDAKFAPNSIKVEGTEDKKDKPNTSLLVAILQELKPFIEGQNKRPYEITLSRSLYGDFFNTLRNTEHLDHDL